MAISKVKTNSITDANVTTAKIADNNVTNAKLATGIAASKLTGALPAISGASLTGVSQFTAPTISSFTPTQVANAATAASITITGANFQDTPRVLFQNANTGAVLTADTVTYNSATEIIATKSAGTLPEGLYNLQVINKDGISVISSSSYTNSATPVWVTSAGSLGTFVKGSSVTGDTFVVFAGDVDSTTITYSETTSVLATANLVLEAFTSGGYNKVRIKSSSASPNSVTTYTFTLRATDPAGKTADRQFSIGSIANTDPTFTTAAGSLGTIIDTQRSNGSYTLATAAASDAEGDTLTYAISAGSLPGGLSLNTSTAAITGTANAVGSDTTSTFSITCTDGVGGTATRQFTITVLAPVTASYTSGTGQFTPAFTAPIKILLVGGGGGGGQGHSGGGGAGGLISHPAYAVTSGTSYPYSVGAGAGGQPNGNRAPDTTFGTGSGTDSTFLTAIGGGSGGGSTPMNGTGNGDGGSGGGKDHSGASQRGQGIQTSSPAISAHSKTYGFGNNGGSAPYSNPAHPSGGGGGAGGAGQDGQGGNQGGSGGSSKNMSSVFGSSVGSSGSFAGGGGGGCHSGGSGGSGGGAGAGNGRSQGNSGPGQSATVANTGSGGGGGAAGAAGIIVLKY